MRKTFRIVVAGLLALGLIVAGIAAINGSGKIADVVALPVASTADVDSAAVVHSSKGTLDVPRNPTEGVTAVVGGEAISIALPNASTASTASRLQSGAVAYGSSGNSSNTVVPTNSGVQMLTTIKSAAAPIQYAYGMKLPRAAKVTVAADGHAEVTVAGKKIANVATPWAFDANGRKVPTRFVANGHVLTQVVDHKGGHYTYPIVADPSVSFGWSIYLRYSKQEVKSLKQQNALSGYGILLGVVCGKLPNFYLQAGCAVSFGVAFTALSQTFQAAANENKCVEVRLDYSGGLDGWRRYAC